MCVEIVLCLPEKISKPCTSFSWWPAERLGRGGREKKAARLGGLGKTWGSDDP